MAGGGSGVGSVSSGVSGVLLPAAFVSRVRLVVWDFDKTLLRIHTFGTHVTVAQARERPLAADFADLATFQALVPALLGRGVAVAVASFGEYEVIQTYLDRAVGRGVFTRDNISTPSVVGGKDGVSLRGGKNLQLQGLLSTLGAGGEHGEPIRRHQVLFFDDSRRNILWAKNEGYAFSFSCPKAFTRAEWDVAVAEVCSEEGWRRAVEEAEAAEASLPEGKSLASLDGTFAPAVELHPPPTTKRDRSHAKHSHDAAESTKSPHHGPLPASPAAASAAASPPLFSSSAHMATGAVSGSESAEVALEAPPPSTRGASKGFGFD